MQPAVESPPSVSPALEPAAMAAADGVSVHRIQPSRGLVAIDFHELWRYRELLYRLLWRDMKARYKQTFLGPAWAILRPLASMILLSAIFGGLANFSSGTDAAYPLFLYAGMLVWNYFSSAFTGVTSSVSNNAGLLSKVYFPRLYAPLAAAVTPLIDFVLAFTITLGLFAWYRHWPTWHIIFAPVFVLLALVAGLGLGLWLTGVVIRYRDVAFTLPYVVQLGMYATPVLYPVSKLPEPYRTLIALNPMTSVLDGFRWAVIGTPAPRFGILGVSAGVGILLLFAGLFFFRRTERTIIDHA